MDFFRLCVFPSLNQCLLDDLRVILYDHKEKTNLKREMEARAALFSDKSQLLFPVLPINKWAYTSHLTPL